jgi:bifunctional oligoribonuclease and PAP phosphatase NrnA
VYDSASSRGLLLLGRVLSTVAFHADERLATAELTQRMLEETGASLVDSESFINHLRSVKPVEVAMIFREGDDSAIHVSMRSKGTVDVAGLAQRFGGGGHRQAAACRLPGSLDSVRAKFIDEALSVLK